MDLLKELPSIVLVVFMKEHVLHLALQQGALPGGWVGGFEDVEECVLVLMSKLPRLGG